MVIVLGALNLHLVVVGCTVRIGRNSTPGPQVRISVLVMDPTRSLRACVGFTIGMPVIIIIIIIIIMINY